MLNYKASGKSEYQYFHYGIHRVLDQHSDELYDNDCVKGCDQNVLYVVIKGQLRKRSHMYCQLQAAIGNAYQEDGSDDLFQEACILSIIL